MRTRLCHHTRLGVYVIGDRKGEPPYYSMVQLCNLQCMLQCIQMEQQIFGASFVIVLSGGTPWVKPHQ